MDIGDVGVVMYISSIMLSNLPIIALFRVPDAKYHHKKVITFKNDF